MPSRKDTWDLIEMAYRKLGTLTTLIYQYQYSIHILAVSALQPLLAHDIALLKISLFGVFSGTNVRSSSDDRSSKACLSSFGDNEVKVWASSYCAVTT